MSCSGYSSVQEAALDFKAVVQRGLPVAAIRYYLVNTKTVIRSWLQERSGYVPSLNMPQFLSCSQVELGIRAVCAGGATQGGAGKGNIIY